MMTTGDGFRAGLGYDIHPLADGRELILGGVRIPFQQGLAGHSDADVLVHAVCDAVLGAIGAGDIGVHFPNTDLQYADISSLVLLERVMLLVRTKGYHVVNIDVVIMAEAPYLSPYREAMVRNISLATGIPADAVNIKATTMEGLGAIGRGEGIAAMCVALLCR